MISTALPILFAVVLWWTSTGAILWLARGFDHQIYPRLILVTIACALGFAGVIIASNHDTVWSVYLAFASAIVIWGFVEFTFLSGLITGNENRPCPKNTTERRRFWLAFQTICHHEYMLVTMLAVIAVLDSTTGSGMAIKTFALLWLMRLGAKLAIFSGAPKVSTEMMPERLSYMATYFRQDRVGLGFWISTSACCLFFMTGIFALNHIAYPPTVYAQVVILTTVVGLALLEHIFMVLPIADSKLWQWAMAGTK